MTRHELIELHTQLGSQLADRQSHSGHSYEAAGVAGLYRTCLTLVSQLIQVDKDLAKLKRGVTNYRPKKKK